MSPPLADSWNALARLQFEAQAAAWEAYMQPLLAGFFGANASTRRATDMTLQALASAAARWASDPSRKPRAARGTQGLPGVMAMLEVSKSGRDGVAESVRDRLTLSLHKGFVAIHEMTRPAGLLGPLAVPIGVAAMREGAVNALEGPCAIESLRDTLDLWLAESMPAGVPWRISTLD